MELKIETTEQVREGYKLTEVGVIPEDWEVRFCFELCDRIMVGIVIRPTQYYVDHGIPALRSANIKNDCIVENDLVYISETSNSLLNKSQIKKGDVLTVRTGYPGTSAVAGENHVGWNCIDILISRPKSHLIDPAYLSRWINSPFGKVQVLRNQGGLAQKHFNVGDMKALRVAYPTTVEQQAIAEALSDADELIQSLEKLIEKKRLIKQGAMQELLTGKRRLPGFTEKWKEKRIGDFTSCKAGGTPNTQVSSYWGGTIKWMSSGELNLKQIYDVVGRISELGLKESSTSLIPSQCVLIGLAGQGKTRGTVAINHIELCTNQSIAAIFPGEQHNTRYLYYHLELRYDELRELSAGDGGRGGLNLTLINSIIVPLPSRIEQSAIAKVLSEMDEEIGCLESKLSKARQLKQGMMQELLTGKIRLV